MTFNATTSEAFDLPLRKGNIQFTAKARGNRSQRVGDNRPSYGRIDAVINVVGYWEHSETIRVTMESDSSISISYGSGGYDGDFEDDVQRALNFAAGLQYAAGLAEGWQEQTFNAVFENLFERTDEENRNAYTQVDCPAWEAHRVEKEKAEASAAADEFWSEVDPEGWLRPLVEGANMRLNQNKSLGRSKDCIHSTLAVRELARGQCSHRVGKRQLESSLEDFQMWALCRLDRSVGGDRADKSLGLRNMIAERIQLARERANAA